MPYPFRWSRAAALLIVLALCCPAAASAGEEGIFFWEARSDRATVYLLGSMHAATADVYPLDRAIEEAWKKSPALVVEVNLDAVDMTKLQSDLLSRGMYGTDQSLQGSISEETWKLLVSYLDSRGLTPAGFGSMKPWFLSMVLTVTEMARAGFQEEYGIDRHFLDLAARQSKLVFELESGDFQLELLSGFDDKMQELFLVTTLMEIEKFEAHMGEIVAAWTSGDAAAMERLITRSSREDKRLVPVMDKLIYQRNETMAAKIAGYLREGKSCFVVVGAAHLVGERGIVELLRGIGRDDLNITRVKPAGRGAAEPVPATEAAAAQTR